MGAPADQLVDTLGDLWPRARVRQRRVPRGRSGGSAGAGGPDRAEALLAEYALAPDATRPSLAVPIGARSATGAALGRFHAGLGPRQVLARRAAAGVARWAPSVLLVDRVEVRGDAADSLAEHLAGVLGQPVRLVVGIGSERVNRKPVVGVFDGRGRQLAFAKVGSTPVAAADVTAEAASLRRLAEVDLSRIAVPDLVDCSPWQGHPVLVATALETVWAQNPVWRTQPPRAAMQELSLAFGSPAAPAGDLAWFEARRAEFAGLADRTASARALACVQRLAADPTPVRVGAWHGDWTPWNMASRGRRGVAGELLNVWDWERFTEGVPVGLDPVHYRVNVATQNRGARPTVLAEVLGPLPAPGRPDLVGLYLMAVTARYLRLAEGPGGDRIAERGRLFLDAWEARSRG